MQYTTLWNARQIELVTCDLDTKQHGHVYNVPGGPSPSLEFISHTNTRKTAFFILIHHVNGKVCFYMEMGIEVLKNYPGNEFTCI